MRDLRSQLMCQSLRAGQEGEEKYALHQGSIQRIQLLWYCPTVTRLGAIFYCEVYYIFTFKNPKPFNFHVKDTCIWQNHNIHQCRCCLLMKYFCCPITCTKSTSCKNHDLDQTILNKICIANLKPCNSQHICNVHFQVQTYMNF